MKLIRFFDEGKKKTGILEDNLITEITGSILEVFNNSDKCSELDIRNLNEVKILPPVLPS